MNIEKIGQFISSGDPSQIIERSHIKGPEAPQAPSAAPASEEGGSFQQMLKEGIDKINQTQSEADHGVKELLAGRNKNIHETMLLLEKADMTYKMAMQVRNKIIDAYREIMKMQV